jgi:D-alanyl-D-alanine carboxypeptidase
MLGCLHTSDAIASRGGSFNTFLPPPLYGKVALDEAHTYVPYTDVSLWGKGVSAMDTQEQDFHGISSAKDAPTARPPLDTLAKTLAGGTLSRGEALKLMGAGTAAVASLGLAGCGSKDQAKGSSSGSRKPSATSTSDSTVAKHGSTPKQGPDAQKVAAAAKRAMEMYHLKAVLAKVTTGTGEVATLAMGESMTGVPATADMHFRNGAVAISYLGTVLLQLVDEGKVGLDDTIDRWLPDALASEKVTLRMLSNCTSGYPDFVTQKPFVEAIEKDPFRAWTTEEQLSYVAGKPLLYEPGSNWSYAHTNFVRLGEALSAIAGEPVDELIRKRIVEPLGMKGTQSHQTAVIPEPVLHAFDKERGTYEESTFWDPSWSLAKGSVMITDIHDLATSARAIGTGKLVSEKSHKEQVDSSLVGLGKPTKKCPEGVCLPQTSGFHYGIGTAMLGGWILQNPSFFGWGGLQAYLPEKDLAIAASATLKEEAKVGLNGGQMVFNEIAAELAPDYPPRP